MITHWDQYEDNESDEGCCGPYELDEYCKNVLFKAYGVGKENLKSDISKKVLPD